LLLQAEQSAQMPLLPQRCYLILIVSKVNSYGCPDFQSLTFNLEVLSDSKRLVFETIGSREKAADGRPGESNIGALRV
jgi:hypothetical protein